MNTPVKDLHAEYCRLIAASPPLALTLDRIYWWEAWKKESFTIEDLRAVIACLQQRIRKGERNLGCLKWSNLIQSGRFGEELAECKAWKRNAAPVKSARERVCEQWSPKLSQPVSDSCVPVAKVIEGMRRAAQ